MRPARSRSANPFATPAMIAPSPVGISTASGTSGVDCAAISSATVFLPSIVNGLSAVFRLYQPNSSHASRHSSNASS